MIIMKILAVSKFRSRRDTLVRLFHDEINEAEKSIYFESKRFRKA